jgi:hypothetical protein
MPITAHTGTRGTTLTLEGSFDVAEAERLHEALLDSDPSRPVTVDFHEVRLFHDLAVARLARELSESGDRLIVHGLCQHHHRLMRYCGLDGAQAQATVGPPEGEER